MRCWSCSARLPNVHSAVPEMARCPECHAWLHCCNGCEHHDANSSPACEVPDTDDCYGNPADRCGCRFFMPAVALLREPNASERETQKIDAAAVRKRQTEAREQFEKLFG
jgi:hypothetical protein